MDKSELRAKIGWILLIIEIITVALSVAIALQQGWEQVFVALQIISVFMVATIIGMLCDKIWDDYEEKENQHPGTYHEIKT